MSIATPGKARRALGALVGRPNLDAQREDGPLDKTLIVQRRELEQIGVVGENTYYRLKKIRPGNEYVLTPALMREAGPSPPRTPPESGSWDPRRWTRPCAWPVTATEARRRQGRPKADRQPPGRKGPCRSAPPGRRFPSAC